MLCDFVPNRTPHSLKLSQSVVTGEGLSGGISPCSEMAALAVATTEDCCKMGQEDRVTVQSGQTVTAMSCWQHASRVLS